MRKIFGKISLLLILFLFAFCEGSVKDVPNSQPNGSNQNEVQREGQLYTKKWSSCLDYTDEQLQFSVCNGQNTQDWKFLTNGQIVHNISGLCISLKQITNQYKYEYQGVLKNCNSRDKLQIWTQFQIPNSQWIKYIMVGCCYGRNRCWDDTYGFDLFLCSNKTQSQLFSFFPPPPPAPPPPPTPPSPPPPFIIQGPIQSVNSDLCLDILFGTLVGFKKCNTSEDYKQQWKLLSSGQIQWQSKTNYLDSRNCVSDLIDYVYPYQELCLDDCQFATKFMLQKDERSNNSQFYLIASSTQGKPMCLTREYAFARLTTCNKSSHNQLFSFALSPQLPPSPPPLTGPIKSKNQGQCLDDFDQNSSNNWLGFANCNSSNAAQQWQFLQTGLIKQVSSGLCSTCYRNQSLHNQGRLMKAQCDELYFNQWWIQKDCVNNFCLYVNIGCDFGMQPFCMLQDGKLALLQGCGNNNVSQLFSFPPPPRPTPIPPYNKPSSNSSISTGVIIFIIFAAIILCSFIIFSLIVMYRAVIQQWRNKQYNQWQQIQGDQNLLVTMGLEKVFQDQDNVFDGYPDWWFEIQIPEGVRDIPISDLRGIQRLGAGGFAQVYQAEFKDNAKQKYGDLGEQQVALKVMFKEFFQIRESMEAILKEVATMSKLDNQYIVKLLGVSLVIHPSIVMELVPQGSLEDLLKTESYKSYNTSLFWKLKLFLSILKGIEYLHSQNLIHRDLKPANILIADREAPTTKISDFGLAKIQQSTQTERHTKHIAGTRQYMPPEMFDMLDTITKKSDIWALGIIMQEVLRGVRPWEGYHENIVISSIIRKQPPEKGALPRNCPQGLSVMIKSCWEENPDERPSAKLLVEKLENLLQEHSVPNISDQSSQQSNSMEHYQM